MLYNPTKLKESYETTRIIAQKLNKIKNIHIIINEVEKYREDGKITINGETFNLEMKCRKGTVISDIITKNTVIYNTIYTPASSVKKSKEYYLQYDDTLNYCLLFKYDNINTDKKQFRFINTEKGKFRIEFFEVDFEKCLFIDLEKGDIKNGKEFNK